ncbi:hypothetical protein [Fusibacter bizertensis]
MYDVKIEHAIKKNIIAMLLISILVYMIERIYSIFSHGVSSIMMSTMMVTVLVLGVGGYGILSLLYAKLNLRLNFRRFSNLYNAGIATIVVGQFLSGVVSIAGTGSDYIKFYFIIGGMLIVGSWLKGVRS